jgi:hypothetical protein
MKQVVIRDSNINVQEIMKAIRNRVPQDAGQAPPDRGIEEAILNKMKDLASLHDCSLEMLDQVAKVHGPWNLEDGFIITSHRPGIGRIVVLTKKLFRFFAGLFAKPFIHQQAEINRCLSVIVSQLLQENIRLETELKTLSRRISPRRDYQAAKGRGEPLVRFENGKREPVKQEEARQPRQPTAPKGGRRERRAAPPHRRRRRFLQPRGGPAPQGPEGTEARTSTPGNGSPAADRPPAEPPAPATSPERGSDPQAQD